MKRSLLPLVCLLACLPAARRARAADPLDRGWGLLKLGAHETDIKRSGGRMTCTAASRVTLTDYAHQTALEAAPATVAEVCEVVYREHDFLTGAQAVLLDGKAVLMELDYKPDVGSFRSIVARSRSTYGKPSLTETIGGQSYVVWENGTTRLVLFTVPGPHGRLLVHVRYEDASALEALLAHAAPASQAAAQAR